MDLPVKASTTDSEDKRTSKESPSKESPSFINIRISLPGALGLITIWILYVLWSSWNTRAKQLSATGPFTHLAGHCAHIPPISSSEFLNRQTSLARTLHSLNASAYIAEPGASAQFYANISDAQWHLSERPLLLVISPVVSSDVEGISDVQAKVSILTPQFEATRAKLLSVPSAANISFAEWPEDMDPYQVAVSNILPLLKEGEGTIFVDGSIRHFIVDGLQEAAPKSTVVSAPVEVRRLRERKSPAELEILKCANEVTLLSIRAVQKQMYIGMHESEASSMIRSALSSAGLSSLDSIVLFGGDAALPHGTGTDRVLRQIDFALIDCGGTLHGYSSDVTRTFALPGTTPPPHHLQLWHLVQSAQSVALVFAQNGTVTSKVDEAARAVIEDGGYAEYFTHRLGHGIGLEVHESPYLRGGSIDVIQTGHTFSDEPGIYLPGKVGVRLEDCFYVNEEGTGVFLTNGVGGQARSPWDI